MAGFESRKTEKPHFRTHYVWLSILVICALLLIMPATKHVFVQESRSVFEPPTTLSAILASYGAETPSAKFSPVLSNSFLDRVAASHPEYEIQLGCALEPPDSRVKVTRLQALTSRFPSEPSLFAALLRWSSESIRLNRPEVDVFEGGSPPSGAEEGRPTAAQLAAFEAAAARGERIDPDNAYFPMMRAIGLYIAHRDSEALAAIQRAGRAPSWNDYCAQEVISRARLHRDVFGDYDTPERWYLQMECLVSPEYFTMQFLAELATYQAIMLEHDSHIEQGFAIRRALMHCGYAMLVHSTTAIGAMIGSRVMVTAEARPGGGPRVTKPAGISAADWAKKRQSTYRAYLRRIGHPDEAAWAARELNAGDHAVEIAKVGDNLIVDPIWDMLRIRIMGMVLLANLFWFLLAGAVSGIFRPARRQWPIAGVLFVLGVVILAALCRFIQQWGAASGAVVSVYTDDIHKAGLAGGALVLAGSVAMIGAIALPICCMALIALICLAWRLKPLQVWSAAAPVVALIVLLAYCAVLQPAIQSEAKADYMMDRSLVSEGAYMAQELGQTWPK